MINIDKVLANKGFIISLEHVGWVRGRVIITREEVEAFKYAIDNRAFEKYVNDLIADDNLTNQNLLNKTKPTLEKVPIFALDMIHNMEELAELQKELSKWVRGNPRPDKILKEMKDVEIALENVRKWYLFDYDWPKEEE